MQVIRTTTELKEYIKNLNPTIGFVPTMGALHSGHISLIKRSVEENRHTIVSIFVNPTQFLPDEDYEKYPKNETSDLKVCELCGIDAVFLPKAEDMYFEDEPKIIAPKSIASILEGTTRPGHFDGVLTILNKFFNIIRPTNVYFGKKDAQQLIIVKDMVGKFFINTNVVSCDIIREADGLALSSRNIYLDDEEKLLALKISRALLKASNLIKNNQIDIKVIKGEILKILEPLKIDYIAFVDHNFKPIQKIEFQNSIVLIAAYIGKTRLIDNIWT